jgi:hypothetical protein
VEAAGGEGQRRQWGHRRRGDSLVPRNLDVQAFFLLSLHLLLTCVLLLFSNNRQPAPQTSRRNRSTTGRRVLSFFSLY